MSEEPLDLSSKGILVKVTFFPQFGVGAEGIEIGEQFVHPLGRGDTGIPIQPPESQEFAFKFTRRDSLLTRRARQGIEDAVV